MRFFSGSRDLKAPKGKASEQYKARLNAKDKDMPAPTPDEIYKKAIADRMAKMMEDYMSGKKKNPNKLPGTKDDDKPKELSKNMQLALKLMAMKREARERKQQRNKERAFISQKKQKEYLEKQAKMQENELLMQKEAELKAQQEAMNNYWKSNSDNNGWW